jgi:hypothetical protein
MTSSYNSSNNNHNINPRLCVYGCGIRYWNNSVNEYWKVFTKKNIFVQIGQQIKISLL